MAAPTIKNGEEYFYPIIYEGNGAGQRVGKFVPFTDNGTIANSCIFNRADTATMSRTLETPTNGKIWTFSTWFKRGNLDSGNCKLLGYSANNGGGYIGISSDKFYITDLTYSGSWTTTLGYHQNRTVEDTSKWYHFLIAVDTTDSTASDRVKIYIDGDRVTSFDSYTVHPAQDYVSNWNGGSGTLYIGRRGLDTTGLIDGYLAETNFVDGQALLPASFGVTDTSTGRWIPSVVKPYPTTTTDIAVTVVSSGGNKFAVDGVTQGAVTLIEGATYKFDQSDSSNATHPLRFSTTSDGTHNSGTEYTTGVTTAGTPGSSGAYTQITVATGAPTLYYYCSSHSGMGGTANTQDQYGNSGWRLQFLDSTHAGIDTSGNGNTFTASNLIDFESQPIAMGGTAFDTGSAGAWDGSYPVANGFTESTSTQAIYNDGSTAIGGVIGWDFGSGRSANIQHIKINQIAVNNSITGFAFEYSDNGSDYTSVGTFSVTASTSTQTVSVLNTAGKHRYWRLRATTDTSGGQSAYRWIVAFLGFFSEPITTDSPTQNHSTFSPNASETTSSTLSEGNLKTTQSSYGSTITNLALPSSGKYYWEFKATSTMDGNTILGVQPQNGVGFTTSGEFPGGVNNPNSFGFAPAQTSDAQTVHKSVFENCPTLSKTTASGTYIQMCWDGDTGSLWFGMDNTFEGNPSAGTGASFTGINSNLKLLPAVFSQGGSYEVNFGQRAFRYTPPTDFVALQQDNLPETSKGVSDLVWIKNRDATDSWIWQDSLRGKGEYGSTATSTDYATAIVDGVQKFLKGGISIEGNDAVNTSGESYVAHCWNINGGTKTTDTSGDLSVELQANATAGVSVGKFTVSGSGNKTWAHGLGGVPEMGILCAYNSTNYGTTYHHKTSSAPYNECLFMTTNGALSASSGIFGSAKPTSTLWTGLVGSLFSASQAYVFYSFRGIEGFSKFGKYTGNGASASTPNFVYTGFAPSFVMIKMSSGGTVGTGDSDWMMFDNVTDINRVDYRNYLRANLTNAETYTYGVDFLSNGFRVFGNSNATNASGVTYIFCSFAEHPFVGDGTSPVTAR